MDFWVSKSIFSDTILNKSDIPEYKLKQLRNYQFTVHNRPALSISNIYGIAWNLPDLNELSGISFFYQLNLLS